jgi:alpha-mannosidase
MNTRLNRRQIIQTLVSAPLVAALPLASGQDAQTRKRIYIAADDHTDYMWTADEQEYREAFLETLDHYLSLADQTDDREVDYQCRWNCDGLLWLREYEQHRSPAQVERLIKRIKSGHISIPMNMLVSCYGGTPTEAALRGMYYGGIVERKYDLRITVAVAMENQTLPWGLGMLWAGSGVKYSWKGICGCASKLKDSAGNREHDVYWWVGPDRSRILMKWYSLAPPLRTGAHSNEGPGGYAEARYPKLAVQHVCIHPDFLERNPQSVIGLFGQGWDDLKTIVPLEDQERSFPAVAKQLTDATRRVIVSNELDYFADMETNHGDVLPEQSWAFGNEWELYSASLAEVSATVKRATEKLRTAEALAALVQQRVPEFGSDLHELREQAWIAFGLYWEHDWTADGPISRERRATWQRKIAKQITDYVDTLHDRAVAALSNQVNNPANERLLVVFNQLSWVRTDYAEIPLNDAESLTVLDAKSGKPAPSQVILRDQQLFLRFLADRIPACGYRVFKLTTAEASPESSAPTIRFANFELESPLHRLQIDSNGSITRWEYKGLPKPLITDGQRANEFEASLGTVTLESTGPVSTTVRIDAARPTARTTRVTMFESLDRIEIENTIRENFLGVESWRYEFNLDSPQTEHEEVGAIVRAATAKEGGDYADQNARTQWLTMNHFVTLRDESAAVTISNRDCLFFHLGQDHSQPMDSKSGVVHILAGGQIDGEKLGIPKQGGDRQFTQRFALRATSPGQADRVQSMRTALEHQNPLLAVSVSKSDGKLKRKSFSMLKLNSESVVVWALKPAEPSPSGAGQGTVVRLWNLANEPASYELTMSKPVKQCFKTTHVETEIERLEMVDGKVSETLPPGGMRTLRFA